MQSPIWNEKIACSKVAVVDRIVFVAIMVSKLCLNYEMHSQQKENNQFFVVVNIKAMQIDPMLLKRVSMSPNRLTTISMELK